MITGLYAALLALFLFFLIANIIAKRRFHKVALGDGGVESLSKAVRIHGNFIELVPILLFLMYLMEVQDTSRIFLHLYGAAILVSRLLHYCGLNMSSGTSFGRFWGTLLALGLLLLGAVMNLYLYAVFF